MIRNLSDCVVPDLPWRRAQVQILEVLLVLEGVHRLPEPVVPQDGELALRDQALEGLLDQFHTQKDTAVTVPLELLEKAEQAQRIFTLVLEPPVVDSKEPMYELSTAGNSVAVKVPLSPPIQEPVDANVPENSLLFVELVPVNTIIAPLSRVIVTMLE